MSQFNTTPWFPDGDPLDPLISQGQNFVKLPQRFCNDIHQTYDIITWLFPKGLQDISGFFDTVGIFANPFTLLSLGFTPINSFLAYERFTPSDFPYDEYVIKIYEVIDAFRLVNSLDNVQNIVTEFGQNVDDLFQGIIPISQPTKIRLTYLQKDYDGSNKISHKDFLGINNINFQWKPNNILPWSVDVLILYGDDISDEIKQILANELLFDNIDFPLPQVNNQSQIEILQKRVTKSTQTIENEFSIEETRQITKDCCPISWHLWGDADDEQVKEAMRAFANTIECNDTDNSDSQEPFIIVAEPPLILKDEIESETSSNLPVIIEDNEDANFFTGIILQGEFSTNNFFWDITNVFNIRDETVNELLEESFFDVNEEQFSFLLVSKANNNHWNLSNINFSDFGDVDFNVYYRQQNELKIDQVYFAKDITEATLSNDCNFDSDANVLIDDEQTETVRGDPNSDGSTYLVSQTTLCDNPIQQYRDVTYTKKKVTETIDTTICDLIFNYPDNRELLTTESAINTIDSWWYDYFYPVNSDIPELRNG